jgi:hypothetical protein
MSQPKKKVVKKPVKKQSHPSDDYKNMINPATGKKGGVGGEGTTPPFGPIKEGTRYYDMDKQKYSYRKKTDPPIKKPSMKMGGKMKKAQNGLGMKSVKSGFDNNSGVTRADFVAIGKGKAKSGTKVKKAMMGTMAKPMMKSGGSMKKCKYGCK